MKTLYFKSRATGAVFIECAIVLGKKPLFSLNKYNKEWVIDLPYSQLIYTPPTILSREHGSKTEKNRSKIPSTRRA